MKEELVMKKKLALVLSTVLAASFALAGCGGGEEPVVDENVEVAAGDLKTGIAIGATVAKSTDAAADAEGLAQTDAVIAAVVVDAEGKIVSCELDMAQTKIGFSADGKITTDPSSPFLTKQELGEDYGLKKASKIGKEWYEQADAFAAYCIGKTAAEVLGISAEEGDLKASVSVSINDYQATVAKAVENAVVTGAQEGDKLGLGVVTDITKSTDAAADADGLAQAYTTVTAVTVGADGKITSSVIDAVQANVNFDAAGKITSDLSAAISTKNELGDSYGLKKASSIGKEWYEQAAAYAAYAVGKTVDEVNATELTEGVPADADLAASVTVHVTDFNTVITKAVANAE